jgi:hypothetical protein
VRAANRLFRAIEELNPDTDWLFFTHDDVEFVYAGWSGLAIDVYEKILPDGGILECFGLGLCSHYLTKRSFIRETFNGRLADTRYMNYYSDSHMLNECAALKKYAVLHLRTEDALMNHQVSATRDSPSWEVQEAWFGDDKRVYKEAWPDQGAAVRDNWIVVGLNKDREEKDEESEQSL